MGPWKKYTSSRSVFDYTVGEGVSTVFDFAYNLYWLKYLKLSNQLSAATQRSTIVSLKKGKLITKAVLGVT